MIIIDKDKFRTNNVNCPIEKFRIREISDYAPLLKFEKECPADYDDSESCRSIIVPTNRARLTGGNYPEFKF